MSGIEPPRPTAIRTGFSETAPAVAPAGVREAPAGLRAAQPGTILEATVLGRDSAGHLMLRTERGLLVLATRSNPPTGAQVTLQLRPAGAQMQAYILSIRPPAGGPAYPAASIASGPHGAPSGHETGAQPPAAAGAPQSAPSLTRTWPALTAALFALQGAGSASEADNLAAALLPAGNPLAQAVPQPGPALANGLLFLIAALRGGDLSRWLGDGPLRALERSGGRDLLQQLQGEFRQLGRLAQDVGDHWRLFALPILGDDGIRPVRLFLRRHDAMEDIAEEPARFVVELELSHLGELQLDGLARSDRLDMILRSRAALAEPLHAKLDVLFRRNLAALGCRGELTFQAGESWHFLPIVLEGEKAPGVTA